MYIYIYIYIRTKGCWSLWDWATDGLAKSSLSLEIAGPGVLCFLGAWNSLFETLVEWLPTDCLDLCSVGLKITFAKYEYGRRGFAKAHQRQYPGLNHHIQYQEEVKEKPPEMMLPGADFPILLLNPKTLNPM